MRLLRLCSSRFSLSCISIQLYFFLFSFSPYAKQPILHTTAPFFCPPYANRPFLHTSPFESPDLYANRPFLHTSPSESPYLYANRPFLHTSPFESPYLYAKSGILHTGCRYPLKSTLSNARVGVSLARQRRASAPAARSPDQSVRMLPVISISRTGCTILPFSKR